MFDKVLLCMPGEGQPDLTALREAFKSASIKNEQNGQAKGSSGGKGRGKKQSGKREVVDLRTLLINCAQAIAADDRKSANELLKQIRLHSSPFGDGNRRLAHCFADGLEARLAGTGSQIYKGLVSKRTSAADLLKAYRLYLAACPFRKVSNFVSNKTISITAKKFNEASCYRFWYSLWFPMAHLYSSAVMQTRWTAKASDDWNRISPTWISASRAG